LSSRVLKARDIVFTDDFAFTTQQSVSAAAQEAALAEAYERGLRDGQQGALSAVPMLVAGLDEAVRDLRSSWVAQTAEDRRTLVGLAAELAQWMLGRELLQDPSLAVAQINEAVDHVVSDSAVTVYVAPEMVDVITESWHPDRHASVQPDPTLLRGELRVVAGVSKADLRWADALERAREALDAVEGTVHA
jgi:flagellar biosynthesis/type III secretory pathway protein FliH